MLSRFWYFLIAALAGVGIAAAYVAQESVDRQSALRVEEQLRRDRGELELWLRYDARERLDGIAPMAAHGDVRNALRAATTNRGRALDSDVRDRLGTTLARLNQQLQESAAQLLFAVDDEGEIVAQLGGSTPPAGAGLAQFPVVRRALDGYVTDDFWIYNDALYRVAARPVIDQGRYVGAIVHCVEVDNTLAERLSSRLPGASLGFFMRENLIAGHAASVSGAPGDQLMESKTAEALEAMGEEETAAIELDDRSRAIYSFVNGSARYSDVGYVIARPFAVIGSPLQLFQRTPDEVIGEIFWPVVVGVPLLLGLLGILFLWLERDRPLARFREGVAGLAKGQIQRVNEGEMRGAFRRIAADLNEGLEKVAGTGMSPEKKKAADLDEILGPAGAPKSGGGGYFGFANDGSDDAAPEFAPPPQAPSPVAAPPMQAPTPAPAPPAPIPAAAPPTPPPPMGGPPSPQPDPYADDDDDGATMVAQVPEELLAAAAEQDDEQRHFREVYEEFVEMKRRCGEATAGLTFLKFSGTLRKNKQAIVQKHGVKDVRFTVYEKNGKAALKATPVK